MSLLFFCGQKDFMQITFTLEMHPVYSRHVFCEANYCWLGGKNARWAAVCIRYQRAISRSSVTWKAVSMVLCIGNSEARWRFGQNVWTKLDYMLKN